jgi:hypothetical protein
LNWIHNHLKPGPRRSSSDRWKGSRTTFSVSFPKQPLDLRQALARPPQDQISNTDYTEDARPFYQKSGASKLEEIITDSRTKSLSRDTMSPLAVDILQEGGKARQFCGHGPQIHMEQHVGHTLLTPRVSNCFTSRTTAPPPHCSWKISLLPDGRVVSHK